MVETIIGMGEIAMGLSGDLLTALGLGSCVCVVLYDPVSKIGGAAHVMLPDSTISSFVLPERTVLLADADMNVRRHIREILAQRDYTVIAEPKAKDELIDLYRQHHPSVSLVSAFLPPVNWTDAVQLLLQVDHQANVVILSPQTDRTFILDCLNRGVKDVVTDPFTEDKIVSSLDYVLFRRHLKFADFAIPILRRRLIAMGAKQQNLIAMIAGGAHMFPSLKDEEVMRIGERNVEAVKAQLHREGIRLVKEETGANVGRTVRFDVASGELRVSTRNGLRTFSP